MNNLLFHYDLLIDGIRCVSFKPGSDEIFLIGTDEGMIYKCTTEYYSIFLETYEGHDTPINNITWNTYITSIFASCGSEWLVKIWDENSRCVDFNHICFSTY